MNECKGHPWLLTNYTSYQSSLHVLLLSQNPSTSLRGSFSGLSIGSWWLDSQGISSLVPHPRPLSEEWVGHNECG